MCWTRTWKAQQVSSMPLSISWMKKTKRRIFCKPGTALRLRYDVLVPLQLVDPNQSPVCFFQQRNQFPDLVPTGTGTEWAGITGGRVLNAKQATASRSSSQSSRQVLDRVARAAAAASSFSSSSTPLPAIDRFPPLHASTSSATPPGYRQNQHKTPWASASLAAPSTPVIRAPTSIPGPGAKSKTGNVVLSKSAFPELPTSSGSRVPRSAVGGNQSLRNILGESSAPTTPVWGAASGKGGSGNGSTASTPGEISGDGGAPVDSQPAGKKKGKAKQKQMLFSISTRPS